MKRLGVNIDHVASVRNARGEIHPSPLMAAKLAIKYGANSITIHLREDRRHIRDKDLINIISSKTLMLTPIILISWNIHLLNLGFRCRSLKAVWIITI